MSSNGPIQKVAIVGVSGRVGGYFAEALLATGKHEITALVRPESKSELPAGVKTAPLNVDDEQSMIKSMQGQQMVIITLPARAPPDTHTKITQAAIKAKVPYIMPNAYGGDIQNKSLCAESLIGNSYIEKCDEIEKSGTSSFICFTCGFWYEWSIACGPEWFGFDFKNKKAYFIDDGTQKISISTWKQCGRALAALLSLPESGVQPALSDWKNKPFYISSFRLSQRDMLDSINRVMGTSDKDWEIVHEKHEERYATGMKELQNGVMTGFAKAMYTRCFYPVAAGQADGDFETTRGVENAKLGLPKEDLDEATKRAVDMVQSGWSPFG